MSVIDQLVVERRRGLTSRLPVLPPDVLARLHELSPAEKAHAINVHAERLRRMAPTSLEAHAKLLHRDDHNRPLVAWPHQLEWIRVIEAVEKHRWVVVIVPPGYGKSTWLSVAYPAWEIGRSGGQLRVGLVSNTGGLAFTFADAVKNVIQTPEFQTCYPGVAPDPKRGWGRGQFFVKGAPVGKDPTLLASGIGGSSVLGRRFDRIILDDPTTWENARSEAVMNGHRHWLKTTLLSRFPPGEGPPDGDGRMIAVLTRWAERDLVPELEDQGFHVIRMPALGYWDRAESVNDDGSVEVEDGVMPLWPEQQSLASLLALKEQDETVFQLVYQGDPSVLGGDVFDTGKFQYGPPPSRRDLDKLVQYVDTAGGKDRDRGDYFVDCTLGRQSADKIWVMDCDRNRYTAPEQQKRVVANAERWDPTTVVIEDANEGRALYQNLVSTTRLPLKARTPTKDKEWRAIPWANCVNANQAWLPDRGQWVHAFVIEHGAFPKGRHDDQVDSAAGAHFELADAGPRIRMV